MFPVADRHLAGTLIDDVRRIPNNDEPQNQIFGFVPFVDVKLATDSFDLDIFAFLPANIPASRSVIIFDKVTLNFVEIQWDRNPGTDEIDSVSNPILFTEDAQVAAQKHGLLDHSVTNLGAEPWYS